MEKKNMEKKWIPVVSKFLFLLMASLLTKCGDESSTSHYSNQPIHSSGQIVTKKDDSINQSTSKELSALFSIGHYDSIVSIKRDNELSSSQDLLYYHLSLIELGELSLDSLEEMLNLKQCITQESYHPYRNCDINFLSYEYSYPLLVLNQYRFGPLHYTPGVLTVDLLVHSGNGLTV